MLSSRTFEERPGFLRSCLVEGDPAQEKCVRRRKQRALFISIAFQILVVAALALFPLLTRGERISPKDFTPLPPVGRLADRSHTTSTQRRPASPSPACRICPPNQIPRVTVTRDTTTPQQTSDEAFNDSDLSRYGSPDGNLFGNAYSTSERGPAPPEEKRRTPEPIRRIKVGTIEPALLVHRVEPIYPRLAIQTRHEGSVELRAVISTDGSIQSLELISGDPLLIQSALAAVREWRYRPTILNGQPVEVDTHITVVYTLAH